MTANDRTDALLEGLIADFKQSEALPPWELSPKERDKKNFIRGLMNIRMPRPLPDELLGLQDAYLQEELALKGIVTLSEIPTVKEQSGKTPFADKFSLWQGDITRLKTGAIVNAANSQMLGCFVPCHRCIDNAIHSASGMQLRDACNRIMKEKQIRYDRQYKEPVGTATLTESYNLPCDYVIHTVGPIVYDVPDDGLCQDLQNCYENVLKCCVENQIRTVAFCCISTGEFHFPNDMAAKIAVNTVTAFLEAHCDSLDRIVFNVFKDRDREIYAKLLGLMDA